MPFIVILGCDGSGKSTVIERIVAKLEGKGQHVVTGHWRPSFGGVSEKSLAAAEDPHGQKPRSVVGSLAKLVWISVSWWCGWLTGLRASARKGVLIFDRCYLDLFVDPIRYRYGGPEWIARIWCTLLPKPDVVLFLDADEDTLLARKQEVERVVLSHLRKKYIDLMGSMPNGFVIDATRPVEEVVAETWKLVFGNEYCNKELSGD